MADTQRFDEFQKEAYQKSVKSMREMLFGNGGIEWLLPVGYLIRLH
jgi:hypothetical protein